ncbi:MAG: hypothetical protein OXP66_19240 [Candidatus Tectomicrobia bacterium]|nr:hypothetical protein [Candidatus Tectomicrobia bacterium]
MRLALVSIVCALLLPNFTHGFEHWGEYRIAQQDGESNPGNPAGAAPPKHASDVDLAPARLALTGYYHPETDAFIVPHLSIDRFPASDRPTESNTHLPIIHFRLRDLESDEIIQRIPHPAVKVGVEVFYEDANPENFPLPISPCMVVFDLPEDREERDLLIEVFSPEGRQIFSASIWEIGKLGDNNATE